MGSVVVGRTVKVTVETDTVMVVRHASTVPAWCPRCEVEVDVIGLESDGLAEPAATAQIQEWLDTGALHHWQPPGGPTQICLSSMLRCFEQDGIPRMRIAEEAT